MVDSPYLFASYARSDGTKVDAFITGLKEAGINVWSDFDLRPGDQWQAEIAKSLMNANGLLVFVSASSMKSKWVVAELASIASDNSKIIIPIIIEHVDNLPNTLSMFQWIDISSLSNEEILRTAKAQAPGIIRRLTAESEHFILSKNQTDFHAQEIVREIQQRPTDSNDTVPNSVFVIHGHDDTTLRILEEFLKCLNVKPVVLKRIGGPDQSLWQKFKRWSKDIRYAIAILSPDDLGASRLEYHSEYEGGNVEKKALQLRARQNVILELGYFYGYLDWDKVFVLLKPDQNPYPKFEMPSDLAGIVYDTVDKEGHWQGALMQHLTKAGFVLNDPRQ